MTTTAIAPGAAGGPPAAAGRPAARLVTRWVVDPLIAIGLGAALGGLLALEAGDFVRVAYTVGLCAFTGFAILLAARLFFGLLGRRINRLGRRARIAAHIAVLAASGVVAWFAMYLVALAFLHVDLGKHAPVYLGITAGMAVGTGLVFYSFDLIRSRLEASVARLKEVEFAEKELQLARELQGRLLPPPEIAGDGYRVAARNLAARLVAGDFYDSFLLPDGAVGVAVGDVAGKGMAAALIMASVKAMLPLVAAGRSAAETLREINRRLAAELPGREFVALAFARFSPAGGRVELANAGLPDPYLLAPGRPPAPQAVPGPRLPLGVRHEVEYRSLTLSLDPGDRLLLFTDGLAEAPAGGGEPLGYAALAGLLPDPDAAPGTSPLAWIDALLDRVRAATRPGLEDDWTALLLEHRPTEAAGPAAAAEATAPATATASERVMAGPAAAAGNS
jgi:Stage II sporulation protein E (SpoIIE)